MLVDGYNFNVTFITRKSFMTHYSRPFGQGLPTHENYRFATTATFAF